MPDYQYENEKELSAYPIQYTIAMALANNNVINYLSNPYNTDRLQQFIHKT